MQASNSQWYKDAVFYEVYVRGFFDSDRDGNGDLRGLVEKLDYLRDLGIALGLHCQTEIAAQWLATAHEPAIRDRYLPDMIAPRILMLLPILLCSAALAAESAEPAAPQTGPRLLTAPPRPAAPGKPPEGRRGTFVALWLVIGYIHSDPLV